MKLTMGIMIVAGLTMAGCCAAPPMRGGRFHGGPLPELPAVRPEEYRIRDAAGRSLTLEELADMALAADVVVVGEEHDDLAGHRLKADLFALIHQRLTTAGGQRPLALSLEMFERDVQPVMDEYLAGLITERHFTGAARPWPMYGMFYRPLVEFAREHKLPVVAANAPGRYVNRVARLGPDSLNDLSGTALSWLPPLPCPAPSPAYAEKFRRFWEESQTQRAEAQEAGASTHPRSGGSPPVGAMPAASPPSPGGHDREFAFLLAAQSLWDAGMAQSLARAIERKPGTLVFHVNGRFHSDERLGMVDMLRFYAPESKVLTITMTAPESFPDPGPAPPGLADVVVLTRPRSS